MKTTIRFLTAVLLLAASVGCAVQRKAPKPEAAALYAQALKALEQRRFVIEVSEVFDPSGKSLARVPSGSYLLMEGSHALIRFSLNLNRRYTFNNLELEDHAAEMNDGIVGKQGEIQYRLTVQENKMRHKREVLITLYKDTNKCFVQINGLHHGGLIVNFKGYVYPARN